MIAKTKGVLRNVYDKHYKKLLIIPFSLIILALIIIAVHYSATGELFRKDVSLRGGVTITIIGRENVDINQLENYLAANFGKGDVSVRSIGQAGTRTGLILDAGVEKDEDIKELLSITEQKIGPLSKDDYSVQVIGSSLGKSFFQEAMFAVLISFILMAIVVLFYFRSFVPSMFVIWAVVADILCTFATLVLFDQSFSSASIAALLMLIGYSVDTDILLTARVLKNKEGTVFERTLGALGTGLTLSLTALAAVAAGYFVSQSETIRQIMLVIAIGMIFDMIHTWLTNAGVLRWYLESKEKKEHGKA